MVKRIVILLLIVSVAFGYFEISNDVPTIFSDSADQQWRLWAGNEKADELFNDSTGILMASDDQAIVIGNWTPGNYIQWKAALGFSAGANSIGAFQTAIGGRAGQYSADDDQTAIGWGAGWKNTKEKNTSIGVSAGLYNDGVRNTAIGHDAFNTWTADGGSASTVASVEFADNQMTTAGVHGWGANTTYLNLVCTTTGVLPTGLDGNQHVWQIISTTEVQCFSDSFTDAGTGTHTLTPQVTYTNSTALGYNAEPDASFQIMLGDLFITEVKTTGSLTASGAVLGSLDVNGVTTLGDGGVTDYTEIDSSGSVVFVGNAGLCYADMYVVDNTTPSVITTMGVAVQVTIYDTDGPFNSATPDHTNDHITIVKAGDYKINVSATVNSVAGSGSRFEMTVQKNDGAAALGGLHVDRHLDGGGVSSGSVSMTGIVTLALNDTVEIWIENETGTQNYVVEDSDINIIQVGG